MLNEVLLPAISSSLLQSKNLTPRKFRKDLSILEYIIFALKNFTQPLRAKKKLSSIFGLLYSKRPARPHGFSKANDKLIRVLEAEISYKMCVN